MTTFEQLPPDQRATLSLLLRKHKTYAEVAATLDISASAVHDRAHAALAVLAPGLARELTPELRSEVSDYLLGQQDPQRASQTRGRISGSAAARDWAQALTAELAQVSGGEPDQVSGGGPDEAPPAVRDREPGRPSVSRRGGLALLGALIVIVIVAVVLIVSGGKGKGTGEQSAQSSGKGGAAEQGSEPQGHLTAELPLTAAEPGGSAKGGVEVVTYEGHKLFLLAADGLEPSAGKGFFYAVWLLDPKGNVKPTGYKAPTVSSSGNLSATGVLPSNASDYERIELTRETGSHPTSPGRIVLEGAFKLHTPLSR